MFPIPNNELNLPPVQEGENPPPQPCLCWPPCQHAVDADSKESTINELKEQLAAKDTTIAEYGWTINRQRESNEQMHHGAARELEQQARDMDVVMFERDSLYRKLTEFQQGRPPVMTPDERRFLNQLQDLRAKVTELRTALKMQENRTSQERGANKRLFDQNNFLHGQTSVMRAEQRRLNQIVAKKHQELTKLNRILTEREGEMAKLKQILAEKEENLVQMEEKCNNLIKNQAEMEQTKEQLGLSDKQEELEKLLCEKEKEVIKLTQISEEEKRVLLAMIHVEREEERAKWTKSLAEKSEELDKIIQQCQVKKDENDKLTLIIIKKCEDETKMDSMMKEKDEELSNLKQLVMEKEEEKIQLDQQLAEIKEGEKDKMVTKQKETDALTTIITMSNVMKEKDKELAKLKQLVIEKYQEKIQLARKLADKEGDRDRAVKLLAVIQKEGDMQKLTKLKQLIIKKDEEKIQLARQLDDKEKERDKAVELLAVKQKEADAVTAITGALRETASKMNKQLKEAQQNLTILMQQKKVNFEREIKKEGDVATLSRAKVPSHQTPKSALETNLTRAQRLGGFLLKRLRAPKETADQPEIITIEDDEEIDVLVTQERLEGLPALPPDTSSVPPPLKRSRIDC